MAHTSGTEKIGIDHAGFVVPDLKAAVAFFADHFGAHVAFTLDPIDDPSGASVGRIGAKQGSTFALAMLDIGDQRVELLQWWPCLGQPPSVPNVAGAAHLALTVTDVGDFLRRIRDVEGVRVLSEPLTFDQGPTPGMTNAFFMTPWGLLIELVSWS